MKDIEGHCKHLEVSEIMKREPRWQPKLGRHVETFEAQGCYNCDGRKDKKDNCNAYEPKMWRVL